MRKTKLIILRGPSGSGKSTIAKMLLEKTKNPTALIEQDHYRFIFKSHDGGSKQNSSTIHKMIKSDVLIALNDGYDVILEGILSTKSYASVLNDIFASHHGENYMYYFDISFDETLRRHKTRKIKSKQFTASDMKEWYLMSQKSNHELEQIIPEHFSLDDTVTAILRMSKLKTNP